MSAWRPSGPAALVVALAVSAVTVGAIQRAHGRLFPPEELGLLEGPDRDAWQKPDLVMDALGVADGGHVADLGAGGGWFTVRLARRVGPNGIVYAEDIQPEMIEAITRRVVREALSNVRVIHGEADNPRLPRGELDAVLIVDAYHEMEEPVKLLRHVVAALKPRGRLGVIDFRPNGHGPGPPPEDRREPQVIVSGASRAGLRLLKREEFLPYQYLLVFGRASGDATPAGLKARPASGGVAPGFGPGQVPVRRSGRMQPTLAPIREDAAR